jgi:hypothetical protein
MQKFSLWILMALVFSACAAPASQPASQDTDWTFSGDRLRSVSIANTAGDIVIHSAEGNDISMTARKSAPTSQELNTLDVQVQATDETLRATVNYPEGSLHSSVTFDLHIPQNLSVEVESSSGNITVTHYQGTLQLNTSSGKITLQDVGGEINASSSSGNIETEDVDGNIHLSSNSGDIIATYRVDPKDANDAVLLADVLKLWSYQLTPDGAVSTSPDLAGNERLFENSSGSITLRLLPAAHVDIFAQLFSGDFKSDFNELEGSADSVRYTGHLNGGGPLIILTNASGAIRLERMNNP